MAVVLHCPSCGAAANPHATGCAYCSAVLALASCPSCLGTVFTGSRHCVHCGDRVNEPALPGDAGAGPHKCPRCRERPALTSQRLGDVAVEQCPTCTGVFVRHAVLERLVTHRDEAATVSRDLGEATRTQVPFQDVVTYLPCAACDALMGRQNFGKRSGVIIDTCKKHGVWFDADELRRVAAFAAAGGLDESRRREIEELDRKISEKKNKVIQHATSTHELRTTQPGFGFDVLDVLWRIIR